MSSEHRNLLLVEDSPGDADIFQRFIRQTMSPVEITHAATLTGAISACRDKSFDAVLLDLGLPDSKGTETTLDFCELFKNLPVIVLTGFNGVQLAKTALSHGAQDYLSKNEVTAEALGRTIHFAIERQKVRDKLTQRNNDLFEALKQQIEQTRTRFNFFSTAVHQLTGPLELISACVESLQLTRHEQDPLVRKQLMHQLEQAIEVVFEFTDALQVEAVYKHQKPSYTPQAIHLGHFCKQIIATTTKNAINPQPIHPQGNGLSQTVSLDPILLRYVLQNLLDNALLYAKARDYVELIIERSGSWINFTVRDRGIGIPFEEQSKVLDPFYRATNGRAQAAGSGLGLAIVKSCVDLHKGTIEIDSKLGQGTSVYVSLPLAPNA